MSNFYLDYTDGSDGVQKPLGWWVIHACPNAGCRTGAFPVADSCILGATSAAYAFLTIDASRFVTGNDTSIWLWGKSGSFYNNEIVYTRDGSFVSSSSDFYTPWKTTTTGAAAARTAPGDNIRILKSPPPTYVCDASWTSCSSVMSQGYTTNTYSTITQTSWTAPINVTTSKHNLVTGNVVQILSHLGNNGANGIFIVDVSPGDVSTFTLRDSSGNGIGRASGTWQDISWKAVVLNSRQTLDVEMCGETSTGNGAWLPGYNASGFINTGQTITRTAVSTDAKQGRFCMDILLPTNPSINTCWMFKNLPTEINGSAYQNLTFWFKNRQQYVYKDNIKICLCSDTSGQTIVNTFRIPPLPSISGGSPWWWYPMNISVSEGGNCAASIKSVAFYTDASNGSLIGTPASAFRIDNISLCTSTGLNLQSLISKNNLDQGGSEFWYTIQSIEREIVILDQVPTSLSSGSTVKGYYGSDGNAPTYKRETTKTWGAGQTINEGGSAAGGRISYYGGWCSSCNTQNGETFYDALGANGTTGFATSSLSFLNFNRTNFYRYSYGFTTSATFTNVDCSNMSFGGNVTTGFALAANSAGNNLNLSYLKLNNNATGISVTSASGAAGFSGNSFSNITANNNTVSGMTLNTIVKCNFTDISLNNNHTYSLTMTGGSYDFTLHKFKNIYASLNGSYMPLTNVASCTFNNMILEKNGNAARDTTGNGILLYNSYNNVFTDVSILGCGANIVFSNSANNTFNNVDTSRGSYGIESRVGGGYNYFNSCKISETTPILLSSSFNNTRMFFQNYQKIANNQYIFADLGNIVSDSTVTHGASGYSWKMNPTNASLNINFPLELNIAKIACTGGATTNVKAWFKTSFDNSIGGMLMCKENDMIGIYNDISVHTTTAVNWQQLSINITPTVTGVAEIVAGAYWKAGAVNSNLWVDDMTIT